jgi:hypothetical protein
MCPGLTYIGPRVHDPATGQFTSLDPVLDPADPPGRGASAIGSSDRRVIRWW